MRAEALLGRSLPDPREAETDADRLIGMGVSLHKSIGSGLTPTLLLPGNYVAGHVPDAAKLAEILRDARRVSRGADRPPGHTAAGTLA